MLARSELVRVGIDPRRLNRIRYLKKLQVLASCGQPVLPNLGYVLSDCEIDNFTYELENEDELAEWIATTLDADIGEVYRLLVEARSNSALYGRLRAATARSWFVKTEPPLGRRLGWYVIVRLLRPARIVETGIHDGLGSLTLLAALDRNEHGVLVSTDVDKTAGWIVGTHPRWERRILGDPAELTEILEIPTDLFLHDSLHTVEHETFELELAAARMDGGILISDNSHSTDVLKQVAERYGRNFAFWSERPRAHFYEGAGIGVAL